MLACYEVIKMGEYLYRVEYVAKVIADNEHIAISKLQDAEFPNYLADTLVINLVYKRD